MKKTVKYLNFDFKVLSVKDASQECIVEGYANTKDKDRVGDVVLPSAFEASLPTYLKNPVLLENHNWDRIAGVTKTAEVTDNGLFIRARISDTRMDLKTQIREGCLSTFSIGYNELDADFDEASKTKIIKNLELLEISIVSVPANPQARFQEVSGNQNIEAPKDGVKPASDTPTEAPKSAEIPQTKSVKDLTIFLSAVSDADVLMDNETIVACCDYFNSNEEPMKKDELIKLLREKVKNVPAKAKNVPAKAAETAPATEGDPAPAEAAPEADGADLGKVLESILSKLNQLGDAVAQMMEAEQGEADADDSADAAPADAGKTEAKPAAAAPAKPDAAKPATPAATTDAPATCSKDGAPMEKDAEGALKCTKCGEKADAPAEDAEKSVAEIDAEIAEIDAALATL